MTLSDAHIIIKTIQEAYKGFPQHLDKICAMNHQAID